MHIAGIDLQKRFLSRIIIKVHDVLWPNCMYYCGSCWLHVCMFCRSVCVWPTAAQPLDPHHTRDPPAVHTCFRFIVYIPVTSGSLCSNSKRTSEANKGHCFTTAGLKTSLSCSWNWLQLSFRNWLMVETMKFTNIAQEGCVKMVTCTCINSLLNARRSCVP